MSGHDEGCYNGEDEGAIVTGCRIGMISADGRILQHIRIIRNRFSDSS